MKTVFHVSDRDVAQWTRVLGNIPNLLDDPTVDCERTALVVNGDGVGFLTTESEYGDDIRALSERGVEISACQNTLTSLEIGEDDLHAGVGTVPSAMGELTRLQHDGFAYVKP